MGRKRKPTNTKRLEGNRGNRDLPENEPPELAGMPEPPEYMDGEALKEWHRVCKDLHDMGILSRTYRPALTAYCDTWGEFVRCRKLYNDQGPLAEYHGSPVRNPLLGIINSLKDDLRRWLSEFGLTAASKSKVEMNTQAPAGGLASHLLKIADHGE